MSVHRLDLDEVGELSRRGLNVDYLSNILKSAEDKGEIAYIRVLRTEPSTIAQILFVSLALPSDERKRLNQHLMNEDSWNWDE